MHLPAVSLFNYRQEALRRPWVGGRRMGPVGSGGPSRSPIPGVRIEKCPLQLGRPQPTAACQSTAQRSQEVGIMAFHRRGSEKESLRVDDEEGSRCGCVCVWLVGLGDEVTRPSTPRRRT